MITPAGFERRFAGDRLTDHEANDPKTGTTFVGPGIPERLSGSAPGELS